MPQSHGRTAFTLPFHGYFHLFEIIANPAYRKVPASCTEPLQKRVPYSSSPDSVPEDRWERIFPKGLLPVEAICHREARRACAQFRCEPKCRNPLPPAMRFNGSRASTCYTEIPRQPSKWSQMAFLNPFVLHRKFAFLV